ncbi:MAG: leucine-rich repeat domain-containing protein [Chlamydiae bacterium]|nr:leucine-rich repeat domain-containing protein [Chlamydiota bacterium]
MFIDGLIRPSIENIIELFDQKNILNDDFRQYDEMICLLGNPIRPSLDEKFDHSVTLIVDHHETFLDKIHTIATLALQNPLFNHKEKWEIYEKAEALFTLNQRHLETHDCMIPIELIDDEETKTLLHLPMKKLFSMQFFKKLLLGDFQEANNNTQITIKLPKILQEPCRASDFSNLLNYKELNTSEALIPAIFIADYLEDQKLLQSSLEHAYTFFTSEELLFLIATLPSNEHIPSLAGAYIRAMFKEGISPENLLKNIAHPDLQERIKDISIDLDLSNLPINDALLKQLTALIPHVRSLDLQGCKISSLPALYQKDLENLGISGTNIARLPYHFPNLKKFDAYDAKYFSRIDELDNSTRLTHIDVSYTEVIRAPVNCVSLEAFEAMNAPLFSIDGLNGLVSLTLVEIGVCTYGKTISITSAPHGCPNLETFVSLGARLTDISGICNSSALKTLHITSSLITSAPHGCPNLEIFIALGSTRLSNIENLHHSKHLKQFRISKAPITHAPFGCLNLETFEAVDCEMLTDISGLNNLQKLQKFYVFRCGIDTSPAGYPSSRG